MLVGRVQEGIVCPGPLQLPPWAWVGSCGCPPPNCGPSSAWQGLREAAQCPKATASPLPLTAHVWRWWGPQQAHGVVGDRLPSFRDPTVTPLLSVPPPLLRPGQCGPRPLAPACWRPITSATGSTALLASMLSGRAAECPDLAGPCPCPLPTHTVQPL